MQQLMHSAIPAEAGCSILGKQRWDTPRFNLADATFPNIALRENAAIYLAAGGRKREGQ